ncbi:DUF1684 domain-containing protein [Nocardia otitidiscaviarum]|uniref:DUF1684 domain-containing protein n=1 Tax=Nocardia otitidiscaviarum TaxID=1823 RepID=UPI00189360C7|nr:DUF1684 domain-containing protein [Nocardia otitidiscaviarum]MBF6240995.1 DUF1684 domain-containing protein [Nocardia otitidiscaviarum]
MTATVTEFEQRWAEWRSERDRWARQPLGWLSLTGLHWLGETGETFEGLPGTWWSDGESVHVRVESGDRPKGDELWFDSRVLSGTTTLTPREAAPGLEVRTGQRVIEVIRRSGQFALRIHDPAASALASFTEIPVYQPDSRWLVTGRFEPYEVARVVTTGAVVDGLVHHHPATGTVTVRLGDSEHRLIVFGSHTTGLHLLFTDATSGVTTYGGARRLDLPRPGADGSIVLDFNRAANLPCAFTDYATCPVAPPDNRLPVAIEAGERDPRPGRAS